MHKRVFLDSNILIYAYSNTELEKQLAARTLVTHHQSFISTQVLQELCNILVKKFGYGFAQASIAVDESCNNNMLFTNHKETVKRACDLADKYRFSFYDSMIVSAAMQCECEILFSEDLHHGQMIEGKLLIKNPFL